MKKNKDIYVVLFSAILFTLLFYKKPLGLNLLIYEWFLLGYFYFKGKFKSKNIFLFTTGIGTFLTSIFTVISYSTFSYLVNFFTLFLFVGVVTYPEVKSLINAASLSVVNLINSQLEFIQRLNALRFKNRNLSSYIRKVSIFIVPLVIIVLFIFMYSNSNPVFDELFGKLTLFIKDAWLWVFKDFNFFMVLTFLLGLVVSTFILIHKADPDIIKIDLNSTDNLKRIRKKVQEHHLKMGLHSEYKAGVFLLIVLNFLLLVLNVIDVKWVWFGFSWEGQYLKQFVHEGTYLLICSILLSIALVLYYFRDNLNFFQKNTLLKYLSYAWLIQNAVLVLSVAMRNIIYIKYFALAYKRIGVFVFLLLTLYGLYTVYVKVRDKKSSFYLFKKNSHSLLILLIVTSFFNWDNIIAKYNFSHADRSFVHLNFLAKLSDKSLPYLDKSMDELNKIDSIQQDEFSFRHKYMTAPEFHKTINDRKFQFQLNWESKGLLSWNLPEYDAYKKLGY